MGMDMTGNDKLFAFAMLLAVAAGPVSAAGLAGTAPAELPPTGFVGTDYVDSRGCLFQRAETGGTVVWVARIDAKSKQRCGFKPTRVVLGAGVTPAPYSVVPKGFRRAWTDGRLNPHRGPRTIAGNAQMSLMWTDGVPAELVGQ